jgi:hypothetical protein
MNKILKNCSLVILGLLISVINLSAQEQEFPTITATFNNLPVKTVLEQLDSRTDYTFYFKTSDLSNKALPAYNFEDTPLDKVLEQVLSTTRLGYIAYRNKAIVILPRSLANQAFTADYYRAKEAASVEVAEERKELKVGDIEELSIDGKATVSGVVRDADSREPVIGASVSWEDLEIGTVTGIDGDFEMTIPAGVHYLRISYLGYEDINTPVRVMSSGQMRLRMEKGAIDLEEVTVSANKADANVESAQIGVAKVSVESIKKNPALMGEADVVKTLLQGAGVTSVGEGAAGFNVRGGDVDQNLILLNEAILLNSSHALGFFSAFNTDLLQDVQLYKANMPSQFGGRLASVMDVQLTDGDFDAFKIKGGVGPITSRLSFEGPVVKEKVAFYGGLRSSYINWLLGLVDNVEVSNSNAFFYDANFGLTARLNDKNTLSLSGYGSQDEFTYNEDFGFDYSTYIGQMSFKSVFNDKLLSNFSAVYNTYNSNQFDIGGITGTTLTNAVDYIKLKEQLTFSPSTQLRLDGGISGIFYTVKPGDVAPYDEESNVEPNNLEDEKGFEAAAFLNSEINVNPELQISAGLRLSYFSFLGPKTIYEYEDPDAPSLLTTTGTTTFGDGESIANYFNLEPRVSLRYRLGYNSSVKGGYSRTVQYINQIFNADSPTPVSQWQLSTNYIKPTKSHNFSLGYFLNLKDNNWETSAEIYARTVDQLFDYKDFADLTNNAQLETELLPGEGRSYGLELAVKKKVGEVYGTLTYTLSRSERLIQGINDGDWYPSNFDKPHDVSLVFNYQPNRRNTLTVNFVYGSGRPTTPPVGNYVTDNGLVVPVYAQRNAARIPAYHRMDIAYTLGKGYKRDKKFQTSWTLAIYNVYARRNAYSVYFTQAAFQGAQANKLAILGTAFPSLTFNFEIL